MEELIYQAFLKVSNIGPHVSERHYDLMGPNGDIILPQLWEEVIEPDMEIVMYMWPIPEKPIEPEPSTTDKISQSKLPGRGKLILEAIFSFFFSVFKVVFNSLTIILTTIFGF
jgi:hypothetical protein